MCYCYSTSPSTPSHEGSGLCVPLNLAGLYGSSLNNAQGFFVCVIEDGWAVFDIIPVPIVFRTGVLGLRGFGFGVKVSGAALEMGGGVVGVSSFLRNRWFLKVILPDLSTLKDVTLGQI